MKNIFETTLVVVIMLLVVLGVALMSLEVEVGDLAHRMVEQEKLMCLPR